MLDSLILVRVLSDAVSMLFDRFSALSGFVIFSFLFSVLVT